ncbi:MAG: energy-coupling factor ABC transporter permease [Kiritimatiellae bacterium]|nr:energy-coupling factor ABC transporter permease [Kiritimatiellia bacterium]
MHMADALITPAVGGTMWAVSGGLMAWCARKLKQSMRDDLVPMMGVLGAFVFAAQMINFTIPGTGSSGHLGGGLILAILLGPQAAFLVIASVLTVQAFFFADGGLLALGCNLFNMGFFPAFVAYPLIYRPLAAGKFGTPRAWWAAVLASMAGLLMGSVGVVVQTTASGISELPFGTFVVMMVPIHLAIGLVEGLATAVVVDFVARARPEVLQASPAPNGASGLRPVLIGLGVAALLLGGVASWFASTHPDGLEWSIARVTGQDELAAPEVGLHERLAVLQESTAFLPDYGFKTEAPAADDDGAWPSVSTGTSVSGLVGGVMALGLALLAGFLLRLYALRDAAVKES